jgi:PAS domain S-box-containing protein
MTLASSLPRLRAPGVPREGARAAAVVALLLLEVPLGAAAVHYAPPGTEVAAYWPNAGIALLALFLARRRWRPAVLAGIFVLSTLGNLLGGRPLDLALVFGVTNVVEAALILWLLTRHGAERPPLESLEDFGRLVLATLAGATVAGLIGGLGMVAFADGSLLVTWRTMLSSHGAAILLIAPLGMRLPRARHRAAPLEAAVQWTLLMATTLVVYAPGQALPVAFLAFPLLVWAAARFTPRQVVLQLIVYGGLVAGLTTTGNGPFYAGLVPASYPPETVGTLLQANLIAAVLVALPPALVRNQQVVTLDQLTRSHALVSNILASTTGTAILGTDVAGRLEFFNVGAEAGSGYRSDEVVGHADLVLTESSDGRVRLSISRGGSAGEPLAARVEPFFAEAGDSVTADWEFVRRDGEVRTVALVLSRRLDEAGTTVGYLAVADDVTERRRHEARVEAALEAEKQIVERLAQVDQTKNDFLSSVSHELRTPITSIVGYSQLLLHDEAFAGRGMPHELLGRIERNGRRLMGLIEDMLTMSQVEVGNFRFDKAPLDLREPVLAALEAAQPALEANALAVVTDLGDRAVAVLGDGEKLERVVVNLLSNAAKFSHRGDTIVLRLVTEGDQAVLTVTDTGLGISLEEQAHLFDRFFRGADAHAHAIQGVGLGLPIADAIVAGHDGRIDVASELGQGSTFVVRLPVLDSSGASVGPVVDEGARGGSR